MANVLVQDKAGTFFKVFDNAVATDIARTTASGYTKVMSSGAFSIHDRAYCMPVTDESANKLHGKNMAVVNASDLIEIK